jgi:oxepin-CoA hydrolase/3-oxo-5,6-dehydrosuberyl-CoA semialdehyde dehydrogenase
MSNGKLIVVCKNRLLGEELQPLFSSSLREALNYLIMEIEDYDLFFLNNPDAMLLNVTFGKLNKTGWDIFHKKHFTHHLSQFSLL